MYRTGSFLVCSVETVGVEFQKGIVVPKYLVHYTHVENEHKLLPLGAVHQAGGWALEVRAACLFCALSDSPRRRKPSD